MKKLSLFIILAAAVSLHGQSAGNSGLSFLKFGFGARNIAMGDAGVSSADDITALFYNPARLAGNYNSELIFMHNEWIQDVRSEVFGAKSVIFGLPVALGLNVTTVRDIEVRTVAGEPESYFNANNFYGSISTGFNVAENVSFGTSIKYLYEGLYTDEATGFGFDFGLDYKTPVTGLSVGAVLKNLGSMNSLRAEETRLPSELRIGSSYLFNIAETDFDLAAAAEYHKYLDTDDNHFNLGAEVVYDNLVALRGGYQSGYESRSFTAGIGLIWGNLNFDYAFLPFSLGLGSANLLSLKFKF